MVLYGKSSQEYSVSAGVPQDSILDPTLFLLYINDLPANLSICADDTTLCCWCDQASDLLQELELAAELESDLRDTIDWGRKWLVDFNAGKIQLGSFGRPNSTGIDVKTDGSDIEKKSYFKMLGCFSVLNWIEDFTLSLLLNLHPRKLKF